MRDTNTEAEQNGIGDEGRKKVRSNPVQNGGSGPLPTVRIRHKDHPSGLIINESDFDPKKQKLFDAEEDEGEGDDDGAGDDGSKGGNGAGAPAGGGSTPAGEGTQGAGKGAGKVQGKGKGK